MFCHDTTWHLPWYNLNIIVLNNVLPFCQVILPSVSSFYHMSESVSQSLPHDDLAHTS